METDETLINFTSYRTQKQLQSEQGARNLFSLAQDFAIRYANIREKVRAKDLFCRQINYSSEIPLPSSLDGIFQQWFLFDYQTIQGDSMFSLFLKQKSQELSEPELILGALFLATYLEPFEYIEVNDGDGSILARSLVDGKNHTIKNNEQVLVAPKRGYAFFRRLPLLTKDWVIGPIFPIDSMDVITQTMETFNKIKVANPPLTWRTFLKRNGYFLVAKLQTKK